LASVTERGKEMLVFWKETLSDGGLVRQGLGADEVVLLFPNGDKIYMTALENGVRIRAVQDTVYPLQIRPESATAIWIELRERE